VLLNVVDDEIGRDYTQVVDGMTTYWLTPDRSQPPMSQK
jgi:hypothetical protein